MCGIAGFIDNNAAYQPLSIAQLMGDALYSRGPDDAGLWSDNESGVNLVHRRLAIVDLSNSGHQPMLSKSGRYVIVFNGEVYNFNKLRLELEQSQIHWNGHSDTEVILHGFEVWGIEATLKKCEGMFAIALWDRQEKSLYLMRDRMGEKPLYYGYFNGVFGFASELKALKQHPRFIPEINRDAVGQLLLHSCIPSPISIYKGINKLIPGHYLKLSYKNYQDKTMPEEVAYWQLTDHLQQSFRGNETQAVNELEALLLDVVKDQMQADVPLGCFLSGGIDSSTIAALMQAQSTKPIKTFSIGFDNPAYNEAGYAKAVARHLGSEHTELFVNAQDMLNIIPKLPDIYNEPFADSSQLPVFLVAKLARTQVTVALSGDGGDEVFAGYNRYVLVDQLRRTISKIPVFMRPLVIKLMKLSDYAFMHKLSAKFGLVNIHDKVDKISGLLNAASLEDLYMALTGHWLNINQLVHNIETSESLWLRQKNLSMDASRLFQLWDSIGYLPDDILVKVDRAAMANSLETRIPFLNHRVVEFANSLGQDLKIRGNVSKYVLRQVVFKYVPPELLERHKQGFTIPINSWLRGELKDWACALLDKKKLQQQGYLDHQLIEDKLQAHLSGRCNYGPTLWNVLMFQQWLERQ